MVNLAATDAGQAFRAQREALGLNQSELGARLDVHYTTVARWELAGPPRMAWMAMAWLLARSELRFSVATGYAARAARLEAQPD